MGRTQAILLSIAIVLAFAAVVGWLIWRSIKCSDDPPRILFKWIVTLVLVTGFVLAIVDGPGIVAAFTVPFLCVALGVALSLLWTPHIAAAFAKPITSLFDGGDREPDPQPLYSIAMALRNKGNYEEALRELRKQLERFPNDVIGQMMLAELQAVNLNDFPSAAVTLQRFCHQPSHAPKNIAYALNLLADWHLKFHQDAEAAREALEQIVQRFPATELAQLASQRIAHLGSTATLLAPHDRAAIPLHHGADNVGLLRDSAALKSAEADPAAKASALVQHLEHYPLDSEAREELALIYAGHYQRLDLAAAELEQLIAQPNQPPKQAVHWLNLLADLHIKYSQDVTAAGQALQRIIDRFPGQAAAENAQRRLGYLKLELKGGEKAQAVKLGSYDQDVGLNKS
ncbi:MAG TPA: outer membrane protein assembly factor BamD [Verrucomicrobiae bacterium]|jgi:outer membrane protein assembly factor BamD (BamD/ComL family)